MPSSTPIATRLVGAVLLVAASTPALAEDRLYAYRINGYPAAGDCHAVAATIERDFVAATGIANATGRCADITPTQFAMEITYLAEAPLKLVSTEDGSIGSNGVYARLATCELAVQREKDHFEAATGLTAVVAYCQRLESNAGRPYVARVDGFGEPTVRPFISWTMLLDPPATTTVEDLEADVEAAFRARGFDVRSLRISQGFYGDAYLRYYAEEKIRITSDEMARLATLDDCAEQMEIAQRMPHAQVLPPLAVYCASGLSSYYVKGFYQDLPSRTSLDSAERFPTYAACQRGRAALVSAYATRMGAISDGLCTFATDDYMAPTGYRVRLFVR